MRAEDRLRRLFAEGFRAIEIASPLLSYDADKDAGAVRGIMDASGVELVGVRVAGLVGGYARRDDLAAGSCAECMLAFDDGQVLSESSSLQEAIEILDRHHLCFIATLGTVDCVVTRQDVGKPQARMWLFGMVTMTEMALTRALVELHPLDSWKQHVAAGRLEKAEALLAERRRRKQSVGLLDCLQFADKAEILIRDAAVVESMGLPSRTAAKDFIKRLESLRNNLAHTQDIVTYDWTTIAELARRLDRIVSRG